MLSESVQIQYTTQFSGSSVFRVESQAVNQTVIECYPEQHTPGTPENLLQTLHKPRTHFHFTDTMHKLHAGSLWVAMLSGGLASIFGTFSTGLRPQGGTGMDPHTLPTILSSAIGGRVNELIVV